MPYSDLEEEVIGAWIDAACRLRFRIHPRYVIKDSMSQHETLFFLPDFGGPRGMVALGMSSPDFATDKAVEEAAKRAGLFCSFINLEIYRTYDESVFLEALQDWKYPYTGAAFKSR
jgi:hypothetical protein